MFHSFFHRLWLAWISRAPDSWYHICHCVCKRPWTHRSAVPHLLAGLWWMYKSMQPCCMYLYVGMWLKTWLMVHFLIPTNCWKTENLFLHFILVFWVIFGRLQNLTHKALSVPLIVYTLAARSTKHVFAELYERWHTSRNFLFYNNTYLHCRQSIGRVTLESLLQ